MEHLFALAPGVPVRQLLFHCPTVPTGLSSGMTSQQIVQKLWNECKVLRDDGLSYGDYVEQLTYLLFLKMAHERTQPPLNEPSRLPVDRDWPSLTGRQGPELEAHYTLLLTELAQQPGLLGQIFR